MVEYSIGLVFSSSHLRTEMKINRSNRGDFHQVRLYSLDFLQQRSLYPSSDDIDTESQRLNIPTGWNIFFTRIVWIYIPFHPSKQTCRKVASHFPESEYLNKAHIKTALLNPSFSPSSISYQHSAALYNHLLLNILNHHPYHGTPWTLYHRNYSLLLLDTSPH